MSIRRVPFVIALATLAILTATTSAVAQDVMTAPIREGKVYWVTRSDGSEIRGFITARTLTDVRVNGAQGEVAIPTHDVLRIAKVDGLWNGFAIGAGAGLAFAVPWALSDEASAPAGQKVVGSLVVAAMYGGIGALIDKAIERRTVLFRREGGASVALAPTATPHGLGLRGSVRW
jgi:hypothetical protein